MHVAAAQAIKEAKVVLRAQDFDDDTEPLNRFHEFWGKSCEKAGFEIEESSCVGLTWLVSY